MRVFIEGKRRWLETTSPRTSPISSSPSPARVLSPTLVGGGHYKVDDQPGQEKATKFKEKTLPVVEKVRN